MRWLVRFKQWLSGLGFRVGVGVAIFCVLCYAVSFAQMLLPISLEMKGILWAIFFGLAKAAQYSALLILGKEGWKRLRDRLRRGRS